MNASRTSLGIILHRGWQLGRRFGIGWVIFRGLYAFRLRSGLMRLEMPAYQWADRPLQTWLRAGIPTDPVHYVRWRYALRACPSESERAPRFFFDRLPRPEMISTPQAVIAEADAILAGKWRFFSHTVYEIGFPPDWHLNPMTGRRLPRDRHWSEIGDYDDGDIKLVWEANRFGIVYVLARAYAISHDERYPAGFWQLVEDWRQRNPPMRGPNWKCGQEATFRVMAWCFGLYVFRDAPHTTPERIAMLTAMIAAHGARIAANIRYAIAQHNNHSISEGVGLWTIGILFPEMKDAARWKTRGKRVIESELARQIEASGAHVQRSTNYARLVLHAAIWALRLGELNAERFSPETYNRISALTGWLQRLTDPETGQVPNYGANDGALLLPLDSCAYGDFRSVLQAGDRLTHGTLLFSPGAWDELMRWLFGTDTEHLPHPPTPAGSGHAGPPLQHREREAGSVNQPSTTRGNEGIYVLKSDHSCAMLYCANYHDRPGHADQLHVDLWWYGINVACDAGTYLYNGDPPWQNALSGTAVHNTVTVDDRDQMTRAGRFLWLDWANGTVGANLRVRPPVPNRHLESQHLGYRPVIHCRTLAASGPDEWLVTDELSDQCVHSYRLHWLLTDAPYTWDAAGHRLTLHFPNGNYGVQVSLIPADQEVEIALVRAEPETVRGWRSRYYADREPALSLTVTVRARQVKFTTRFACL